LHILQFLVFQDPLSVEGLRDELETTRDNLDYVQDRIKSGQNDIMALMETKAVSSKIEGVHTYGICKHICTVCNYYATI